jgi:hypothetical protein
LGVFFFMSDILAVRTQAANKSRLTKRDQEND